VRDLVAVSGRRHQSASSVCIAATQTVGAGIGELLHAHAVETERASVGLVEHLKGVGVNGAGVTAWV
jgi:hypothetical protein